MPTMDRSPCRCLTLPLLPELSKERSRSCSGMAVLPQRCCSALCQLQPPALSTALNQDLNWAEMPQTADAGTQPQGWERSSPGRRRGRAPGAAPTPGVFLTPEILKMFLFRASLEAPCTAPEGSLEPCLMAWSPV